MSVSGTGTSSEFKTMVEQVAEQTNLHVSCTPDGYGPSDHASFVAADIPVLYLTTGGHLEYHTPGDIPSTLNYDGMQQNFHDRYFVGEMDYVRFGQFTGFSAGSVAAKTRKPLAAWEFNEPTFVGLDRMANNSTRYVVGSPVVADSTVALDGRSGLQVNLSKVFKRNTFAIEARVKPTRIDTIQNIIVAEPPGRYGDGWMVRLDEGVLTVHFRDEDVDSTKWNVLKVKAVALDEWTNIRVERAADSVKVYQNDSLTVWAATKGDVSQLGYNIGIGYDAVNQARHNRFFEGEIDYIRYYGL